MNRLFLIGLGIVIAAAVLGMAVAEHPGYVLVSYRGFLYEAGLWTTLALILGLLLVIYGLRLVLRGASVSGGWLNPWSRRHRRRRLEQASRLGQVELLEGRWEDALRHLRRSAERAPQPLVYRLGAARAANHLGRYEEADALLEQARHDDPQASLAVGLERARLLIERQDLRQALQEVRVLSEEHPQQPQVLRLKQQLLYELGEWEALCRVAPELRRRHVLPETALLRLERLAWRNALQQTPLEPNDDSLAAYQERWKQVPPALRRDAEVLGVYASRLQAVGQGRKALPLLAEAIREHYQPELVEIYGRTTGGDSGRQLREAEPWLADHPNDPTLLLTLGRLAIAVRLWGKARSYLEASIRLVRTPEACAELARLLQQLGEVDESNRLFREGLELSAGLRPVAPALPVTPS